MPWLVRAKVSILNSKLFFFRYKSIGKQTGSGVFEFFANGIGKFPVKEISLDEQKPFIQKAEEMLRLNADLQTLNNKFIRTLEREFNLQKPSKKLQDWHTLTYADFIKELTKQKITLTLAQKAEWEDYFTTEQTKAQALQTQIHQTDQHIDHMVYQLYGLTDDEIAIIEGVG